MMRTLLLLVTLVGSLSAADVPLGHPSSPPSPTQPVGWCGDGTGRYPGATPPLHCSLTSNVVWKIEVGGGESSPVVVGDRVFLLTDGVRLRCLNRRDGKVLWERDRHLEVGDELLSVEEYVRQYHAWRVTKQGKLPSSPTTDTISVSGQPNRYWQQSPLTYAIATPCRDGRNVYVWLPMGALVAYDMAGRRQWVRVLGEQRVGGGWWGAHVAPSPVLADGKLVVHYDKVYCVEAATGKMLWTQKQRVLPIPSPVAGRKDGVWYVALGTMQILRLADGKYAYGDEQGGPHDCNGSARRSSSMVGSVGRAIRWRRRTSWCGSWTRTQPVS